MNRKEFNDALRFIIIGAITLIGIIGGITLLMGIPQQTTTFYNKDTIVCRERNKQWSLMYTEKQCWKVEAIK